MPPCFLNGTDFTSWNILSFDDASDALPLGVRDSLAGLFSASPKIFVLTKGMSLIGPRPERPAFCAEFEKRIHGWHYRTMIAPGLSGLAQVTGGYDLLPKEKVVLDLWECNNCTFDCVCSAMRTCRGCVSAEDSDIVRLKRPWS